MTIAEIEAALQADATLQTQLIEKLPTLPEGKTFIENLSKKVFEEKIGPEIGIVHGNYDRDLEALTGRKKPDGVKSYVFMKEVIGELQQKANSADPSKLSELNNTIAELQSKIDKGEGATMLKQQLDQMQKTHLETVQQYEKRVSDLTSSINLGEVKRDLDSTISKFKLKDLPQEVKDTFIKTQFEALSKNAKIIDGKVVYQDEKGQTLFNNLAAPMTAEEILRERLKPIIEEERQVAGGGGQGPGAGVGQVTYPALTLCKTKTELNAAINAQLIADGFTKGSADYKTKSDELFILHGKNLPLK